LILDLVNIIHLSEGMENSGKVNVSVIPLIENVQRFTGQKEREARKSPTSREESFVRYHAWRNLGIIASSLKTRFENSSKGHDNPQVAIDALSTLPEFQRLAALMLELENKKIDLKTRMLVLDQVSRLRDTARKFNLIDQPNRGLNRTTRTFSKDLASFVDRVESKTE
jgi:anaerobic glycerol-3-phosphate dehydrogenase